MKFMGLIIDEDVRKEMSPEQIIAMHIAAELKARGITGAKIRIIKFDGEAVAT